MIDNTDRNSISEIPIWFRADHHDLFGILTLPQGVPRRIGVVCVNPGKHPAIDRNRRSVILARRLAASGFHVLRFDYHGTGESSGKDVTFHLERPFTTDLISAVNELRRRGLDQFILIGRCFGARTALSAVTRVHGLRGLALISMPFYDSSSWTERLNEVCPQGMRSRISTGLAKRPQLRWHLRVIYYGMRRRLQRLWPLSRNGDGATADRAGVDWISLSVERWLRRAMEGCVPLLFLHATNDYDYEEFRHALEGPMGTLIAQAGDRAQVSTLPGNVTIHSSVTLSLQEPIITRIQEWVDTVARPQT